jgi:hypothetical protein
MTPMSILIIAHALVGAEWNRLTDIQKQVASKYAQLVNVYDKDDQDYHRFKALSVVIDGNGGIEDRIEQHERRDRKEYDIDYVKATDVARAGKQWKKQVIDEFFSISQERAPRVKIPYFCRALKNFKPSVNDKSSAKSISSAITIYRSAIKELFSPLPDEDPKVPIYLVVFVGNHYGNCKYVKVYIGDNVSEGNRSKTAGRFFVIDVSVYDHY